MQGVLRMLPACCAAIAGIRHAPSLRTRGSRAALISMRGGSSATGDLRLSLLRDRFGLFRLYVRANLREHALVGVEPVDDVLLQREAGHADANDWWATRAAAERESVDGVGASSRSASRCEPERSACVDARGHCGYRGSTLPRPGL